MPAFSADLLSRHVGPCHGGWNAQHPVRALPTVHHSRPGRVDPGDRGQLRGTAQFGGDCRCLWVAFIGSVTLWWIYFDRTDESGRHIIATASDPGRLGRSAYTYFHVPMVAGIILVAAADELMIVHSTGKATAATTALILGGSALYLAGNMLFKWALSGLSQWPPSRPRWRLWS